MELQKATRLVVDGFNRNIVECKSNMSSTLKYQRFGFNRNIVECKCLSIYLIYQVEEG